VIWPLAALGVALFLRLWQIDLTHFDLDQSTILANADAFARTGQIPLSSGLTFSTGGRGPALPTLIATIPMLFTRDAAVNSGFQAAIDALAVFFLYFAGRDLAGRWAGIAAAFMYAVLPAAVMHARVIWNPNLVPFFSAVALWGTIGFARFGESRRLAAAFFALGCAAQGHPLALVLLPVVLVAAARDWPRVRRAPLGWAVLALLIIAGPFLFLQLSTGWADVRAVLASSSIASELRPLAAIETAVLLVAGSGLDQVTRRSVDWPFGPDPALWALLALAIAGAIVSLRLKSGWIVLAWLLLPIAGGARAPDPLPPHYIHALLPAGALLAALGLARIRPRAFSAALLVSLVGWRLAAQGPLMQEVSEGKFVDFYGIPLRYLQQASAMTDGMRGDRPVFAGEGVAHAGLFHFLSDGRFDPRTFDGRTTLLLNTGGVYLVEAGGFAPTALDEITGGATGVVRAEGGKSLYYLYEVSGGATAASLVRFEKLEGDIGHVLDLRGYRLPRLTPGERVQGVLAWEVTELSEQAWRGVRLFAEIVDVNGTRRSTRPDVEVPGARWRQGDMVLFALPFEVQVDAPTGGYWLDTGFCRPPDSCRPPDFQPLPLYRAGGTAGGRLHLGPIKLAGPSVEAGSWATLAVFGDQEIQLVAVERSGSNVSLRWRANRASLRPYTVFVHALNGDGQLVAQHDSPPMMGSYPTSLWDAGELIEDVHPLEGDLASATGLEVGLYDASLQRLTVRTPNGEIADHFTTSLPGS
jgi:hypothetical protein